MTSGNVITVDSCADDGGAGTLRTAIEGANDGDTIDLSNLGCSLITLQNGELNSTVPYLTLRGPGTDALTVDGLNASRVLKGTYLDVSGLTLAHGLVTSGLGGACIEADGDLSLTDVSVTTCVTINSVSSAVGGAVVVLGDLTMHHSAISASSVSATDSAAGGGAVVGGTATLHDSTISGNQAEASQGPVYGGGLFANGEVKLYASTIEGNFAHSAYGAAYGGGVHTNGDVSVLDGSTVSGNSARAEAQRSFGGGINSGVSGAPNTAVVTVKRSTISGNAVSSACSTCFVSGGGVHSFDSIVAEYATFSYNEVDCDDSSSACAAGGGGLSATGPQPASKITLRNATVSGNQAIGGTLPTAFGAGGGIMGAPSLRIVAHNSTIAFNHASMLGGGIAATSPVGGSSELISTIVSNNDTDAGPDDIGAGPLGNSVVFDGSNNLVMSSGAGVMAPGDTLSADPNLLPLTTDDGGRTPLHPLDPMSVAIDAGINPDALGCDQREYPLHRTHGFAPDIGAYELQGERPIFADNFDGTLACVTAP